MFLIALPSWTGLTSTKVVAVSVARSVNTAASKLLNNTSLLEVFQVYPPVLTVTSDGVFEITDGSANASVDIIDSSRRSCDQELAVHSFGNSYGQPFVGQYAPPPCSFNRVTWNLTVVSAGRQYDRLGIVYLGGVEVFRTSTAEPTAEGIVWTYLKDMTAYLTLFKDDQTIIFDLGNLINDVETAAFNVTLTATYFTAPDSVGHSDLILPISSRQAARQDMPSVFTVPPNIASNLLKLPRNVKKAVVTIAATGQIGEEFWWSNVLQSDVNTFKGAELYGYSPFREVQLYIDGTMAGVAWPFPIIFTGGVVPGLWRPIVGIDAFDLKEDEIDISPWLPLLCDGKAHNFTIRVSGLNDDGHGSASLSETTDDYWLVTGKVFVWLDAEGHITTGQGPTKHTPAPTFTVSSSTIKTSNGTNETLLYHVEAERTISFRSTINTSHGKEEASWHQSLTYSNVGNFTDDANIEINTQHTQGFDVSSSGYAKSYSYPLYAYSVYATKGDNISYVANVNRGKDVKTFGRPVFPTGLESFSPTVYVHSQCPEFEGAWLHTTQNGSATYLANETAQTSYSFGTTEQDFTFSGIEAQAHGHHVTMPTIDGTTELFHRYVMAVNGSVVEDNELLLELSIDHVHHAQSDDRRGYAMKDARRNGHRGQ